MKFDLGDHISIIKCLICPRLISNFPVKYLVADLAFLVITNLHCIWRSSLHWINNHRQNFVINNDRSTSILGNIWIICNNGTDFLSLEADFIRCQNSSRVIRKRWHPCQVTSSHHLAGQDQANSWHIPCLACINRLNASMRYWATQDLHMQHTWKHDVIHIVTFSANKAVIFNTTATCAHSADLDFV